MEEDDYHVLVKKAEGGIGKVVGYNKRDGRLYYLMVYAPRKDRILGALITQVAVWRRAGDPYAKNMTARMIYDVLLRKWDGVMSDGVQVYPGEEFWKDTLMEAWSRDYRVGYFNIATKTTFEVKPDESITEFWDRMDDYIARRNQKDNMRFFIIKR